MNTKEAGPRRKYGSKLYRRSVKLLRKLGFKDDSVLIVLGMIIGSLTGVGAVLFDKMIHFVQGICYGGHGFYSEKWPLLIIIPSIGALLVGLITYFFAREAKGHGVPEVMDAIARKDGQIRPRVAAAKAIASALTIGTGGSAGTEGPIIQIGAAIGSSLGKSLKIVKHNMPVLVGAGAAAGISAIFHAPIAGVLFALEIFLRELNFRTFSPVMLASVISSVVVSAIIGENNAIFPLLQEQMTHGFAWYELGNYMALGGICALAAVAFSKMLYATEDIFDKLNRVHYIAKPVIGTILLGLLGLLSLKMFGSSGVNEPVIFGNGYALIGKCIGAQPHGSGTTITFGVGVLAMVFLMKSLATCFTLGSGGSGGVFAPSLFLGAVVGYAFGMALQASEIFPDNVIHPSTYALVGMAAVVAGTTHAPMAGIMILFEMTRNYKVILPVMFAVTITLMVAQFIFRDSIYTLKLRRRGVNFESRADTAVLRRINVRRAMHEHCEVVLDTTPLQELVRKAIHMKIPEFIIINNSGEYVGMLAGQELRSALLQPEALPFLLAGEITQTNIPTVSPSDNLEIVLEKFSRHHVDTLAVHSDFNENEFIGLITRAALMSQYHKEING